MVSTNDLKNGMVLQIEGQLWQVRFFQHHKPGKGQAVVRTKLQNVKTGAVVERTFNAGVKVDQAILDKREMTYLFHDGTSWVFMDSETYDQMPLDDAILGDDTRWLVENQSVYVAMHDGKPISVELPASVELAIQHTDPGVKGDRVSGATKPATLQTGTTIQVPLFVETGDKVKVDTRSGEYLTRVQ
jgi:elongation factor P